MTPDYDETTSQPLTTNDLIEERVSALVGAACRSQLWFLFLDKHDVQLPLIIPISDPPNRPDAGVERLAELIEDKACDAGARSVILVIERCTDAMFTHADKLWARCLTEELATAGMRVRSVLISHTTGVRWFAQDDYRFDSTVARAR